MKPRDKRNRITVQPEFVTTIPVDSSELEVGKLYISMKYNTVVHRCPCGCGALSEFGLHPATRKLIYDGEYVSIEPSIGARALSCRSHYWIIKNQIVWAATLGKERDEWYDQYRYDLTKSYTDKQVFSREIHDKSGWRHRLLQKTQRWFRSKNQNRSSDK